MGFFTTGKLGDEEKPVPVSESTTATSGGFFTTGKLGGVKKETSEPSVQSALGFAAVFPQNSGVSLLRKKEVPTLDFSVQAATKKPEVESNKTAVSTPATKGVTPATTFQSYETKEKRTYLPDTKISAGENDLVTKLKDALPDSIREGLFGYKGVGGVDPEMSKDSTGLLGYFEPVLGKDNTDRVMERYDALIETGATPDLALKVATGDVMTPLGSGANELMGDLTNEQRSALMSARRSDLNDAFFAIGDIVSLGGASKARIGLKEAEKIAASNSVDDVAKVIRSAVKGADEKDILSMASKLTKESDAQKILKMFGDTKQQVDDIIQPAKTDSQLLKSRVENSLPEKKGSTVWDENIRLIDPMNTSNTPSKKRTAAFEGFRKNMNESWVSIRESVQDDWNRVKELYKKPGTVVDDTADPYMREILYHGRVGAKVQEGYDAVKGIDTNIIKVARTSNIADTEVQKMVNEYLIAKHAPERNLVLGDGAAGMTNANAKIVLDKISTLNIASDIEKIANEIQVLNRKTLDVLKEGGVISDELYSALRKKYPNHVPLNRIFADQEQDIGSILTGKGLNVKGTGIKKAVGSEREVADITENVVFNYEQAVLRAEKNIVDNATLGFARNNKHLGLFEEFGPKVVGKTSKGKPVFEKVTDPLVLHLYENGKPVYLRITDKKLSTALQGINREKMPSLFRWVGAVTRWFSSMATRFNPEFAFSNKIRDLQEAMVYMGSKGGIKDVAKVPIRDPKSAKDVIDFMRGKDTKGARLYKQMMEDGGTTGGLGLSTREQVELNISKIRKINRSSPRRGAEMFVQAVDNWNTVFEDSTRLSVYKTALESGKTRDQAAILAKEATLNYNKMGTGGPIINSLWMFSNASIQGSTKMLKAMRNPKVAGSVITSVGASVWATNEWNDMIDPEWREKIPEWDRQNSLAIMMPPGEDGEFNYFVIPVSWGIKPIKVAADYAFDLASGRADNPQEAAGAVFSAIVEGYNPVGGTDFTSAITPTIIDLPVEISRNKGWYGSKIRPDWDRYAPASIQYFDSLEDTITGRTFVMASKGLSGIGIEVSPANFNYAYGQLIGGAGRSANRVVDTSAGVIAGEDVPVKDIPFVNRFYRSKPLEEIGAGSSDVGTLQQALERQSLERFTMKQQAEDSYNQMKNVPKEDAAKMYDELKKRDPEMALQVARIANDDKKGLTYLDRMTLDLGVQNGERAIYIVKKFNKLETNEEKAALWNEYVEKKILTSDVQEQVRYLLENPDKLN